MMFVVVPDPIEPRLHVERERHPHAGARPTDTELYRISSDAGEKKGTRDEQAPNPSELGPPNRSTGCVAETNSSTSVRGTQYPISAPTPLNHTAASASSLIVGFTTGPAPFGAGSRAIANASSRVLTGWNVS